jgi:acetoin utilization deacetylase AcuC-like enzyme
LTTAIVYSKKYLEHKLSPGHPECPERLKAIVGALEQTGLWKSPKVDVIEPTLATRADIELAHDAEYVASVEKLGRSELPLDGDTPVHENTFELALLAAGGAIDAGRAVVSGKASNAFALVRPPGHHAGRGYGGGFCYFNNIAVMVERLKREFKLRRIFILDLDAHCGNGTEDIFYNDASVLFMSIHQDPRTLYPGTGHVGELGAGEGEGYTVNVPLQPGSGDAEYVSVMNEIFIPLTQEFKPELIALSVGFDALAEDPLTQLGLTTKAYGWLTKYTVEQANKLCDGKVVLTLEGGYALKPLADAAVNVVKVLVGQKQEPPRKSRSLPVIDDLKKKLANYWHF